MLNRRRTAETATRKHQDRGEVVEPVVRKMIAMRQQSLDRLRGVIGK